MAKKGRPIGSKDKLRIGDHFTEKEINDLVEQAKVMAKTDPNIMKFLLEQIFGKAQMQIDHTTKGKSFNLSQEKLDNINKRIDELL